ncbi:MAG TPA: hypothetical protein VHH73_08495 [Verrucomicrobiae bacterium]|nr:hypothetical protein [Verrucomicrobiae bacterium]
MKIPAKIKVGLGLVIVFAAGAVCGAVGTMRHMESAFTKSLDYKTWSGIVIRDLNKDLHLTADQEVKAGKILADAGPEIKGRCNQVGLSLVRLHSQLNCILTPEQRAIHNAKLDEVRSCLKEKFNLTLPTEQEAEENPLFPDEKKPAIMSQRGNAPN